MTSLPDRAKAFKCETCAKSFDAARKLQQHAYDVHGKGAKRRKRIEPDDESFASRAVQAEIDRACGIYNPDQEWLLP